jgi:hypothetical protein
MYEAVRNANFEPIIASFKIEALSRTPPNVVIDATSLFTTDVPTLGLQQGRRHAVPGHVVSMVTAPSLHPRVPSRRTSRFGTC